MREPNDRLASLESYTDLPTKLRRAVRAHLTHGLEPKDAMILAGRGLNWRRDWATKAVQAVLTAYGADPEPDYEARVAALRTPEPTPPLFLPCRPEMAAATVRPQNVQNTAHLESTTYEEPYAPESNLSPPNLLDGTQVPPNRPRTAQSTDVALDQIFAGINDESLDFWRSQLNSEQEERSRLLQIIEQGEARLGTR